MSTPDLLYRDFYYPLNVFMHLLTMEEGGVDSLHYGLFENPEEPIAVAQRRSTDMLLARLPSPPAPLLEVGIGLGTTLARLTEMGYAAVGITPDEKQIAMARRRFADRIEAVPAPLETFDAGGRRFGVIIFQESSQYITAETLFARVRELAKPGAAVVVLDEFATERIDAPGALHDLPEFLATAERQRFRKIEDIDLSAKAAPTIDYFTQRLPRHRDRLLSDLGLTNEQVSDLIASGEAYRQRYRDGTYAYRLLRFVAPEE